MTIIQKEIHLPVFSRGFHLITTLITDELPEIRKIKTGNMQVFIKHTSASICINENADSTVREDLEAFMNRLIPENLPYFKHNYEGSDDMPAHIKASFFGHNVQIPITDGQLNLGTWQGIYLGEHRNYGGSRTLVVTLMGQS